MSWIKRNWWLTPAALVVAFDVWAFLTQLGVVGGLSYEPRTNVRFIAASVWLAFAAAATAGLALRDRRPRAAGCLMIAGALPAVGFIWFVPGVVVGLAAVAGGIYTIVRDTPGENGIAAASPPFGTGEAAPGP